ncbi:hypothetical protein [Oricola indica]|uniref:hypothetical protein n=1 Tax=Oricola indica TaxID=2872591 RepID=UPI001CBB3E3D|nr:hypothetical protein [Oricola indica]
MAELTFLSQPGGNIWAAEAPDWTNSEREVLKIGITGEAIEARASARGQTWQVGQMYGVVGTGMIFTQHVFRGLKRDMFVGDDRKADRSKYAVSWAAPNDVRFAEDAQGGYLEYYPAPEGCIFVVYISINRMLVEFPDIFGWAEHWTWVDEDPGKSGAPVEWADRYEELVWSRDA